jgi:hypothetical protein
LSIFHRSESQVEKSHAFDFVDRDEVAAISRSSIHGECVDLIR